MEKNKIYYFVYETVNQINGHIYIGYHSTTNLNDGYKGSGINLKKAFNEFGKRNFKIEILKWFNNPEDMKLFEAKIVDENFKNRIDTYNKIIGGGGTGRLGEFNKNKVVVKDKNGIIFQVSKDDTRYLNGELRGHSLNKVPVKDKNGKTSSVSINDARYLSGELVHTCTNNINVKDFSGNMLTVNNDDPRYLSGELLKSKRDPIVGIKISKALKGKYIGINNKQTGKIVSIETRDKIRNKLKDVVFTQERKDNIAKYTKLAMPNRREFEVYMDNILVAKYLSGKDLKLSEHCINRKYVYQCVEHGEVEVNGFLYKLGTISLNGGFGDDDSSEGIYSLSSNY